MSGEPNMRILHPAGWKAAKGYANGVVARGRTVWLGGQIGWNGDQVFETDDFVDPVLHFSGGGRTARRSRP